MTSRPTTRYAKSGDVNIAYQVVGDGPVDLVYAPGFLSHTDWNWEYPPAARFLHRLASFSRLIVFDKRGTGLSDPVSGVPTLEERMDDVRAVMDAAGSERAVLFGVFEGAPMCLLFAATYPERTAALVLYAGLAKFTQNAEYRWGWTPAAIQIYLAAADQEWGTGHGADLLIPGADADGPYRQWFAQLLRLSASPGMALALLRMNTEIDVRQVLPTVRVPTLLLHRTNDLFVSVGHSSYMAERIPGAKFVQLPGAEHWPWAGDADAVVGEIQEFVTGAPRVVEPDRVLKTVLSTDIVDSTRHAAELGDRRWRNLLERHHALIRKELTRFRGREVAAAGDGFLATFDGPARAIRCATAMIESVEQLGVEIRAGVHTGECDVLEDVVGGIAVHIGARVSAHARPGEVLVPGTVKALVAGSNIAFEYRGVHRLKGVPGDWSLYAVTRDADGAPARAVPAARAMGILE